MDALKVIDDQLTILSGASRCECYLTRNALLSMMEWLVEARQSVLSPPSIQFKENADYGLQEFFFDRVLGDDFIAETLQQLKKPYVEAGWIARKRLALWPRDDWYLFAAFLFVVDMKRRPPPGEMVLCDIIEERLVQKASDGRYAARDSFSRMPFKTLLLLKLLCVLESHFQEKRSQIYENSLFDGEFCRAVRSIFHQTYQDLSFLLNRHHAETFANGLAEAFGRSGDDILLFRTTFYGLLTATMLQAWDIARSSPNEEEAGPLLDPIVKSYDQLISQVDRSLSAAEEGTVAQALDPLLDLLTHVRDNLLALERVFSSP